MKFETVEFHGVKYIVPEGFRFIETEILYYPSFCGAGDGIGQKIIPDRIGGMRIAHVCHVHDEWWRLCENKWHEFMIGNAAFAFNLVSYLSSGMGGVFDKVVRISTAFLYVLSVSTVGWRIFRNEKRKEEVG